jgi:hypothetical protein
MNERIKLLAEQAGILSKPRRIGPAPIIQPGVLNPYRKYVSDEEYIQDNIDVVRAVLGNNGLEKFAELLVFECVNAVMDGTKEGDHYAQRIEHHFDNGPGGILHFGVEE